MFLLRMIGFDDLGGSEVFTTKQLEDRLASQSSKFLQLLWPFFLLFLGIFQVFGRLFKGSADRRDQTEDDDDTE